MVSSWGGSWGTSWLNSWGEIGAVSEENVQKILFPVLSNILVPINDEEFSWPEW